MITVKSNQKSKKVTQGQSKTNKLPPKKYGRAENTKRDPYSSQSRSPSSSYCQACPKRFKITEENKTKKIKSITVENYDKLFNAIEKFYENLSNLPLDLLVTFSQPQAWLTEQHTTHQQLSQKLYTIQQQHFCHSNQRSKQNQSGNVQCQHHNEICRSLEYYGSKLQAIDLLLANIESNMNLLGKINQQNLQKYNSGPTSSIKNSENINSSINRRNNKNDSEQKLSSMNRTLKQASRKQSQISSPYSPLQNKNSHSNSLEKVGNRGIKRWEQMIKPQNQMNSMHKNIYQKQKLSNHIKQRLEIDLSTDKNKSVNNNYIKQLRELRRITNASQVPSQNQSTGLAGDLQSIGHFISTCKSEDNQIEKTFKPKQLWEGSQEQSQQHSQQETKEKESVNKMKTKRINHKEGTQEFFKETQQTKRSKDSQLNDLISSFVHFMKTQESTSATTDRKPTKSIAIDGCLKEKRERFELYTDVGRDDSKEMQSQINLKNLKPLIVELAELKSELSSKNLQIQKLLMIQQQQETVIELFKKKYQQKEEESQYSGQRIKNLERLVEKYQKQIVAFKKSDAEMKEILKNQSNLSNSLKREKEEVEKELNSQFEIMQKARNDQQQVISKLKQQLQGARKNQKVAKQKMQIYKQKYYQVLHEGDLKKMIVEETYSGKAAKIKEIWGILAQHKKNLQTVDGSIPKHRGKEEGYHKLIKKKILNQSFQSQEIEEQVSSQQQQEESRIKRNFTQKKKSAQPKSNKKSPNIIQKGDIFTNQF